MFLRAGDEQGSYFRDTAPLGLAVPGETLFQDHHPFKLAIPFPGEQRPRSEVDPIPRRRASRDEETALMRIERLALRLTNDAQRLFVGRCHVAVRRARAVYALRIFKPPRRPRASAGLENRGELDGPKRTACA